MKPLSIKPISIFLISCLGIIVYSNTFYCSFHFDDNFLIVHNLAITNINNLKNIWEYLPCRFILYLSFALNYHFHQLDIMGYHLVNLGIHLISAILVWWLTLLTVSTPLIKKDKINGQADLIALCAGLIFVTHPIQTESVTYIAQRSSSMVTLFYLASLCFYAKSRLVNSSRVLSLSYYIFSLIFAFMAMLTKEIAITLPLMILLYEICFFTIKKSLNWKYIVPVLLMVFFIPLTMLLFSSAKAINYQEIQHVIKGSSEIPALHYLLTQFRVMVTYLRLIFFPFNQNLDYDYPIYKNLLELPVLGSLLFLTVVLLFAKWLFSKYRLIAFSIFWFFLTLLPESSFFPIQDVISEHRLYLPMVGYSIFLVSAMFYFSGNLIERLSFSGKKINRIMFICLMMIIAVNSILTYQRNKIWKDNFSLWNDAVQKSPHKSRPYNYRGNAYLAQGNFTGALSDYERVIELDPKDVDVYGNLGVVYLREGNFSKAKSDFSKAIELYPDNGIAYMNRGLVNVLEGDLTQALRDYNRTIELNPGYADPYFNRSGIYYQLKQYDKALIDAQKARELGYPITPAYVHTLRKDLGQDKQNKSGESF